MAQEQYSKEQAMEATKQKTPHLEVELQSGGHIYPEDTPQASGKLAMRYMTGEDEEILISPAYKNNADVYDALLNRIILEPQFDPKALSISDREYLILSARVMSLGKDFKVEQVECRECGHVEKGEPEGGDDYTGVMLDLSTLNEIPILHSPDKPHTNEFTFTLPQSDIPVTLKVLTGYDEDYITRKSDEARYGRERNAMSYTMGQAIVRTPDIPEGDKHFGKRVGFYKKLPIKETQFLRKKLNEISGGTDYTVKYQCPRCDEKQNIRVNFGLEFFFPDI